MDPKLTVNLRHVAEGIAAMDIAGEMTRLAEKPLDEAFAEAVQRSGRGIILNFSGLTYMNNKGVGLLVRLLAQATSQRRRLVAVGLNRHYRRVFHLTGLDEGLPLYETEDQAVAALLKKS